MYEQIYNIQMNRIKKQNAYKLDKIYKPDKIQVFEI